MTPAPGMDELARMKVAGYAVDLAKALSYENVGTIEFLMDKDQNFYFIEVNSRLQVEHPVTEMRAGLDLVKEQLEIAAGEGVDYGQDDVELKGAAMQCRINAEDPAAGFAPSSGKIDRLFFPGGAGVRIDTAVYPGYEVPEYYDSLLAKLVVRGNDMEDSRKRMLLALSEFEIEGVKTTIRLQRLILEHEEFMGWNLDVELLKRNRIVESYVERAAADRAELASQGAAIAAAIMESGAGTGPAVRARPASMRQQPVQKARHYDAI